MMSDNLSLNPPVEVSNVHFAQGQLRELKVEFL